MIWSRRRWLTGTAAGSLIACGPFKGSERAPPETPDGLALRLPPIVKHEFGTDARLYSIEDHALPLVSLAAMVRSGFAADPSEQAGMASVATALLIEGMRGADASQVLERYAEFGSFPQFVLRPATFGLACTVHRDHAAAALQLMVDNLRHATLSEAAFEQVRRRQREALVVDRGSAEVIGGYATLLAALGADPPTSMLSSGSLRSLDALNHASLQRWLEVRLRPNLLCFAIAGDATFEAALTWAVDAAGTWEVAGPSARAIVSSPRAESLKSGAHTVLVEWPGILQPQLSYSAADVAYASPNELNLEVADWVVSGLIYDKLRARERVSYGLRSRVWSTRIGPIRQRWSVVAAADLATAHAAIREVFAELHEAPAWVRDHAQQLILSSRRTAYVEMMRDFESPLSSLNQLIRMADQDLPVSAAYDRVEALTALDGDRVARAIVDTYHPEELRTSVVASPRDLELLAKEGEGTVRFATPDSLVGRTEP